MDARIPVNRLNPEPSGWTGGKATSGLNNTRFMSSPCYLFAYGTLLTGTPDGAINRLIENCMRPKCKAYFHGRLHDLGAYPGATPSPNRQDKVWGQVFSIVGDPGRVLSMLDAYEGYQPDLPHQSEFVRQMTSAMQLPCQRPIIAWVYFYNRHLRGASRLLSGDYIGTLQATGRHLVPKATTA